MSDLVEIWSDGLFAVESGAGAPIILMHGGLANHLVCRAFAAPLMSAYRVITPDLRGSGKSIFAGELSWDRFADDVAALMRHLGLAKAVIGGVSFGSGVAVRTALRHPELVDKLVLLTPAFAGTDVGLTPAQADAMRAMDAVGSRAVAEGIEVIFPLFDRLPPEIRERIRRIAAHYDPASVAASTRFMASGAQPFGTASELAAITAPTLVVP
ncbi:MAG TPA: alpha/beta fold hydrolase, partial [Kofleriaceae bacterium]|nr:alpha/beta fold hydrolase [Kofleriaceae bacterium]